MIPVLWATQVYPRAADDAMGGFLHRLARELPARGFAPTIVVPGADGVPAEEMRDGVRIARFRYAAEGKQDLAYTGEMHRQALRRPLRLIAFLRGFRRALRHEVAAGRPGLVHAHWWVPSGWVAAPVAAQARLPLVISLHGTDVRLLGRLSAARPVARGVFRRADRVLPVSRALERSVDALDLGGGAREVLPMPADDTVFTPPPAGRTPPDPAAFVVAARLTGQKRVDVALRAVADLRRQGVTVRLHVAGDGPQRASLETLAGSLSVDDRVVFHGMLDPSRLADLFRAASAVVLPSVEEGYGLTIVEGALCGLPAIGTRSGGIEELIRDGETGRLVDPDDVAALARAMAELAADPARVVRQGAEALRAARDRTPGPLADRLAGIYRALVPSGGPSAGD